jgi:hypothetical protein
MNYNIRTVLQTLRVLRAEAWSRGLAATRVIVRHCRVRLVYCRLDQAFQHALGVLLFDLRWRKAKPPPSVSRHERRKATPPSQTN